MALTVRSPIAAPPARVDLAVQLARVLPNVSADTIQRLAESARIRRLRPREAIYKQGDPVPLTLILEGYGIARRAIANGHEIASGVAPAGVVFGYSAVSGSRSSVGLEALTDCVVAQWPGLLVRNLLAGDPGFALTAIDSMSAHLHEGIERIEGFLHQDARRRVMRILARHRDLFFGNPPVLNRTHLTNLVGTTPEMTRRVIRQLEQDGTVQRVGRAGLRLLRPERLQDVS